MKNKKGHHKIENNELRKVCIKNRTCYYFDIIKLDNFDFDNVLIGEKSHKNILIYDILHKTLTDPKPLRSRFNIIHGSIRIYDGSRYLTLFGSEKYDAIYDRIRYLISLKSKKWHHIFFSHYFSKIKIDSCDSLPIEKILTLRNVIVHIKSVTNKDKNHYHYKIF